MRVKVLLNNFCKQSQNKVNLFGNICHERGKSNLTETKSKKSSFSGLPHRCILQQNNAFELFGAKVVAMFVAKTLLWKRKIKKKNIRLHIIRSTARIILKQSEIIVIFLKIWLNFDYFADKIRHCTLLIRQWKVEAKRNEKSIRFSVCLTFCAIINIESIHSKFDFLPLSCSFSHSSQLIS